MIKREEGGEILQAPKNNRGEDIYIWPPDQKSRVYYIGKGGDRSGPFAKTLLQEHINSGAIAFDDLYWETGMDEWKEFGDMSYPFPILSRVKSIPPLIVLKRNIFTWSRDKLNTFWNAMLDSGCPNTLRVLLTLLLLTIPARIMIAGLNSAHVFNIQPQQWAITILFDAVNVWALSTRKMAAWWFSVLYLTISLIIVSLLGWSREPFDEMEPAIIYIMQTELPSLLFRDGLHIVLLGWLALNKRVFTPAS